MKKKWRQWFFIAWLNADTKLERTAGLREMAKQPLSSARMRSLIGEDDSEKNPELPTSLNTHSTNYYVRHRFAD